MKKPMTTMIIGLVIVFGGVIAFNVIKGFMVKRFFANYQPPAVAVSSVTATRQNWKPRIAAVGNFVAPNGIDVNAQVSGNVTGIHFNSGQFVEQGKLLIDIDDSIEQATLKFNQADLALQKINYQRQLDLAKHNATPKSSVDEAYAKLLEAEANLDKTQASIDHKHITAPFPGQLGIRQVGLGEYIMPGKTAIASLQSMDPLYVEFFLPEQLLTRVHVDQTITFSVEQNPSLLFEGKILAINSRIDSNTHNVQIQAILPNCPTQALKNPTESKLIHVSSEKQNGKTVISCNTDLNQQNKIIDYNFIPGMFTSIDIDQPAIPNVVVLPSTAISFTQYGNSVFVIEKEHDFLHVRQVFVTTGEQQGNYTEILQGIKEGQIVVATGELKLQNGTRVTLNNSIQLPDTKDPNSLGQ